jgi:hypothetical protein
MYYALIINDRINTDVEYKQKMVDAWLDAANKHYEELATELASLIT